MPIEILLYSIQYCSLFSKLSISSQQVVLVLSTLYSICDSKNLYSIYSIRKTLYSILYVYICIQNTYEYRAALLVDQYKKKAQLFRTSRLLVQLGDDFRYDSEEEAIRQYENYRRLFDYINSHPTFHVKACISE